MESSGGRPRQARSRTEVLSRFEVSHAERPTALYPQPFEVGRAAPRRDEWTFLDGQGDQVDARTGRSGSSDAEADTGRPFIQRTSRLANQLRQSARRPPPCPRSRTNSNSKPAGTPTRCRTSTGASRSTSQHITALALSTVASEPWYREMVADGGWRMAGGAEVMSGFVAWQALATWRHAEASPHRPLPRPTHPLPRRTAFRLALPPPASPSRGSVARHPAPGVEFTRPESPNRSVAPGTNCSNPARDVGVM